MSVVPGLALTFDDGPDPVWTPRLLTLLARAGARATFFPIAPRAAEHPALIARIAAEGHTIGFHCHEHVRHSTRDIGWGRRDTIRGLAALRSVGVRPSLWRTPWGDTAPWSKRVASEHDLRIVAWTVDTHDWRGDAAGDMLAATSPGLRGGAIVLAHDGIGPGAVRTDIRETLAYVEQVADHVAREGLALEALT